MMIYALEEKLDTYLFDNGNLLNIVKSQSYSSADYIIKDELKSFDGFTYEVIVNIYERNPANRKACLDFYRQKNNGIIKCEICGFNFGNKYGNNFSTTIEIHHIEQLSLTGKRRIDPILDLIPVCSNCHTILHSLTPPLSIKKVIELIEVNRN